MAWSLEPEHAPRCQSGNNNPYTGTPHAARYGESNYEFRLHWKLNQMFTVRNKLYVYPALFRPRTPLRHLVADGRPRREDERLGSAPRRLHNFVRGRMLPSK